jgi:hypothetical protein
MAPALQALTWGFGELVGCRLVFGLLVQPDEALLALMGSANKVPYCLAGYEALVIRWVVLIPGLTGSPSPRIALATS